MKSWKRVECVCGREGDMYNVTFRKKNICKGSKAGESMGFVELGPEYPRITLHGEIVYYSQISLAPSKESLFLCTSCQTLWKILAGRGSTGWGWDVCRCFSITPVSITKTRKPGSHSYHCLRIFSTFLLKSFTSLETAWYKNVNSSQPIAQHITNYNR